MSKLGIVKREESVLTVEQLKSKFPAKSTTINEDTVKLINDATNDPCFSGEEFIQQMVTYQSVMIEGKYSMREYINALKFCSYLELEDNATEAYKKARANDQFVIDRKDAPTDSGAYKELTFQASRVRGSKLVRQILTQSDMPLYLMFQGARYGAVNVLAKEMTEAAYSKDRINAAKALLEHVKPPENVQIELDIGVKENNAVEQLSAQLATLATKEKSYLESGRATLAELGSRTVSEDIIDAEVDNE